MVSDINLKTFFFFRSCGGVLFFVFLFPKYFFLSLFLLLVFPLCIYYSCCLTVLGYPDVFLVLFCSLCFLVFKDSIDMFSRSEVLSIVVFSLLKKLPKAFFTSVIILLISGAFLPSGSVGEVGRGIQSLESYF